MSEQLTMPHYALYGVNIFLASKSDSVKILTNIISASRSYLPPFFVSLAHFHFYRFILQLLVTICCNVQCSIHKYIAKKSQKYFHDWRTSVTVAPLARKPILQTFSLSFSQQPYSPQSSSFSLYLTINRHFP